VQGAFGIMSTTGAVNLVPVAANFGRDRRGSKADLISPGRGSSLSMNGDLEHDPEEIPRSSRKSKEGYDW